MSRFYTREELIAARAEWKRQGKTVVFTNGCYDLYHPGHIRLLAQPEATPPSDRNPPSSPAEITPMGVARAESSGSSARTSTTSREEAATCSATTGSGRTGRC
jgi:hypothetical protein